MAWSIETAGWKPGGDCPQCSLEGRLEFERDPSQHGNKVRISCDKCGLDPRFPPHGRDVVEKVVKLASPSSRAIVFNDVKSPITKRLLELAAVAESKAEEYGNTYDAFGPVMEALFPDGIRFEDAKGWNRLGVINMIVHKLMRYAENMEEGGHKDSANDIAVYGAILAEVTK